LVGLGLFVLAGLAVLAWWLTTGSSGPVSQADAMADAVCDCDDAACVRALVVERGALDEAFHSAYSTLSFGDVSEIRVALDRIRDCEARFVEPPAP
jgi:hypothetical protein